MVFLQRTKVQVENGHLRLRWDLHLSLSCNPQAEKYQNPQELPAVHPASKLGAQAPLGSDYKVLEAVSQPEISSGSSKRS